MPLIAEDVYLYSFWSGHLRVYKGQIGQPDYRQNGKDSNSDEDSETGVFVGLRKRFLCSSREAHVYNSVVWFSEPNESMARSILALHFRTVASIFKEKMENALLKVEDIEAGR